MTNRSQTARPGYRLSAAVLLVAIVAACGSSRSPTPVAGRQPTTAPTSITVAASPTSAVGTTPTTGGGCPSGIGAAAQSPRQAAQCLYQAWAAGDRASAAVFASLDVVDALFKTPWTPPPATFVGCSADTGDGAQCGFDHHGGRYLFVARRSEGGFRVTQVQHP